MQQNRNPQIKPVTSPPALSVDSVGFAYGAHKVLDNVSFSLAAGETVMLLGPNGAGKTTLFSLISGLFAADTGRVLINGESPCKRASALAPLGIVFQSQTLDLDLSVEQNLAYFCALHGISRQLARQRIDDALTRLDIHKRRFDKVRTLNGGHRRRVEIARATLHKPGILLLDEPTVGLDIPTRQELIQYLRDVPHVQGCAVLWATHLIDEIENQNRVVMLRNGQLILDGKAGELLETTGTHDLAALMQQLIQE